MLNCNITKVTSALTAKQRFGLKCFEKDSLNIFLQTYLTSLGCDERQYICLNDTEPCDTLKSFICLFYIFNIEVTVSETGFDFNVDEFHKGTAPYTYVWTYDAAIFNLADGATVNDAILKLEWADPLNVPSDTDTVVSVIVKDANGCISEESCEVSIEATWENPGYEYQTGMGCF